jgi:two-component SAPR family response regulator
MTTSIISRRTAAKRVLFGFGALAGTRALLFGQEYAHARELVARVQGDLERSAEFVRSNEKERERYHNVQHKLSDFDKELRSGHFDKGKLDDAIDDLKNVVKNNTLESRDRDTLAADLSDLRALRDTR